MKSSEKFFKGLVAAVFCMNAAIADAQPLGWQWQNPYLQGNDLNSIVMNGSIGWAVGAFGTVMKTANQGFDWERVDLGTSENFNCIYMDGVSGRGWIVGNNGMIFYTDNGGDSWVKQRSGTDKILYSVSAIGGDCPWICGNDIIMHSYDHGENWQRVNTVFHSYFFSIDQKDCDEIWISGQQGLLISSKDAGATWQSHASSTANNLYSVDVVPNGDYRACGYAGTIVRSSDAGANWVKEHEKTFLYLYDVDTRGIGGPAYAVGGDGTILETLDGGATWSQRSSGTFTYLNDVCFQALFHGVYVTGWYGIILRKEDAAGAEFEIMNERPLHYILGIDFIDGNTGWAVGGKQVDDNTEEGVIMHTTDGGETWEVQKTLSSSMTAVDFINENEGWAVGENGTIRHTVNGGATWTTQTSPIAGMMTAVFFIDEDNGWIVSRDNWGEICHTSNGGNTWTLQPEPSLNPLNDVFFINKDKGWVVGMDSTIMRTTDGGQTWLKCNLNISNNPYLRSVQFIDEMKGWTVGTGGFILMSDDGGVSWQDVHSGFYDLLQAVHFTDALNGWAVGTDGMILRTIDGGYNWFRQYSGVERGYLTAVCFADPLNGWIGGEGGTIKRTWNGGFWNEPGVFHKKWMNRPIPDQAEMHDTLSVKVLPFKDSGYELVGLELMLDSILHPRVSELEISLTHGNVTAAFVSHAEDHGADFLWMRLKDDATRLIGDGAAPFSGDFKPHSPLSVFNGMDPDGDWILTIYDNQAVNTGTLRAWGIRPLYERPVGIEENGPGAETGNIRLFQNVPNPFTRLTKISWTSDKPGYTTLKIFSLQGQELVTLVSGFMPKGEYTVDFDGSRFNPGLYFYRLQVGEAVQTKKLVLM